ncbi:MAG: TolB family protein [Candidatus Limnocylindria bacterium]
MRIRDLSFGVIAVTLLVGYIVLGQRVAPLLLPSAAATPTPARPTGKVTAPAIGGSIAFILRGDVFVLTGGQYASRTEEGRSQTPALSQDGQTLYFARDEEIDGKRVVDGAVVNARLGYSNIIRKPAAGGKEEILLNGLTAVASGFHQVTWYLAPAPSPDGKRLAVIEAGPDGSSDLVLYDFAAKRITTRLSNGANWTDPSWSPDGKTIVVTAYDSGVPELLLKPTDGAARSTPLKGLPAGEPYRATFSPDGKWIAYTLRHDGKNDVHAFELATSRDVALTTDGQSWNPAFSPDGRQLTFLRSANFVIDLWVMDLGGALAGGGAPKAAQKITNGEGVDGANRPSWGR